MVLGEFGESKMEGSVKWVYFLFVWQSLIGSGHSLLLCLSICGFSLKSCTCILLAVFFPSNHIRRYSMDQCSVLIYMALWAKVAACTTGY